MQSLHYLDLAKTLSDEHLRDHGHRAPTKTPRAAKPRHGTRMRVGHALIALGQRLAPSEVQLTLSTGPPRT
jgi:hypothetical protein